MTKMEISPTTKRLLDKAADEHKKGRVSTGLAESRKHLNLMS